jgi:hypothetical protein
MNKEGATRLKLEEAKFFFGFLTPNFGKEKKFDFYLSAFLSAARAVLWKLQWEYSDVEGFKDWYKGKKSEVDGEVDRLLKGTGDARNRTHKSAPLRTLKEVNVSGVYVEDGDDSEAEKVMQRIVSEKLPVSIGGSPGKYKIGARVDGKHVSVYVREARFDRELEEFPGEHIVPLCSRYYDLLAKIVAECEAKFPHSS